MKNTKTPLKSKTPKVYKNAKLNKASFNDYSLNDYQVFLHIVSKIGGVDESGKYLQPEQLTREYTLTVKEFENVFSVSNGYPVLKKVADKLLNTQIVLEKPDLLEEWKINVCELAKYSKKNGYIKIKFTESIMPYLSQVKKRFILYNLKEIANFNSIYTTRLYELLQEFKDTGVLIKSVAQLREIFATGNKYSTYKDFKVKTFQHAVNEINANFELDLKFIEHKEGRKVITIEFLFNPTTKIQAINPYTGNTFNIYKKPKQKKPNPATAEHTEEFNPNQLILDL